MKSQKGITLVSLVVTIIVLIILAGVSINILLGNEGIITKARQAKENTILAQEEESRQLNTLLSQLNQIDESTGNTGGTGGDTDEEFTNFKRIIATALTNEGVTTSENDTAEVMAENIGKILQERTKNATATADNLSNGVTAWVNGQLITGNGADVTNAYNTGTCKYFDVTIGTTTTSYTINLADYVTTANAKIVGAGAVYRNYYGWTGLNVSYTDTQVTVTFGVDNGTAVGSYGTSSSWKIRVFYTE